MKNIKSIHQFTPSMELGDSVSNAVLYLQKILIEFGFESNIYIAGKDLNVNFKHNICHISEYQESDNQLLLYHHSIGHDYHDRIMQFQDKKIVIYHNITPPHFFKGVAYIQELCILGRKQLESSAHHFIGSIGDSDYNSKELHYYNYPTPTTLTLLLDLEKQNRYLRNQNLIKKYHTTYNIIFVGRIVQNKAQHQLIDIAYALKRKGVKNFKIHIIGGVSEDKYMDFLHEYAKNMGMLVEVTITGKVSDEDLASYYTLADLYLCVSEHEGFGMPLIEAMKYDIPVLAFNTGGISTTVPKECLLENKSPSFIANEIIKIQKNPHARVTLIKKQREKLETFSYQNTKQKLIDYLNRLNIGIKIDSTPIPHTHQNTTIQVEGPFDSTYSLALVNKNIAQALDTLPNTQVKLYATEGGGDFKANLDALDDKTKSLALAEYDTIDITIRNLYPPRTNAMKGYHKIIGPYGWEESKFPQEYVAWFNTKLTMVFAMSEYVKNLLKDNGVYTPIVTTGLVVQENPSLEPKPLAYPLPVGYKLLHISSAFPRKGIIKLLEAFDSLAEQLDISLIIKTFPNPHNQTLSQLETFGFSKEKIYEEDVTLYKKGKKEILLINKDISEQNIKYLYHNTNLLVAPSCGEGFGLPLAEAMLSDLPVLTTAFGGQSDFCTEQTAWLLDFDFAFAQTHMNLDGSIWASPKVESLKEQIQHIYSLSAEQITNKTKKAKEHIQKHYSQHQVAHTIQNSIQAYPQQKPKQNLALFSTYNTRCGIATYAKHLIATFEDEVTIFANTSKEKLLSADTANILRCWDDSRDTKDINSLKENLLSHTITTLIIQYNFSFIPLNLLEELIEFCHKNKIQTHLFLHSTKDVVQKTYTDSFRFIANSLKKVSKIYLHTLSDINYLKDFGIYSNTYLFTHAVPNLPAAKNTATKSNTKTLATFGFLLPQKGVLELVDILKNLHKKGVKAKLLLLTSIHPAPVSTQLEKKLKQKIQDSGLSEYITLNTNYLEESEIVNQLSQADKILFLYTNTQESSSAAVRMGLLSNKEVITTPLAIFDDLKPLLTQTKESSIESISNTIINALEKPYNSTKQKNYCEKNSWKNISKRFYNTL